MQRTQPKWRADRGARALKTIGEIEASIVALNDEDLLDLHDIFARSPVTLRTLAWEEMQRRGIAA